jgi:hypothetical protein
MKSNKLGLHAKAATRMESLFEWVPGANVNVEGEEKTGKNHFAFTAPSPILCISGDRKITFLAAKLASTMKKHIHAVRFRLQIPLGASSEKVKEIARPIWRELEELFWEALQSSTVRTIVVDTGSWAWELKRLAAFGKTERILPVFYNLCNAQFERMLLAGEDYPGKHIIWIHKLGDEWKNKQGDRGMESYKTGKMERKGFKNVGFDVQANIRTSWDKESKKFTAKVISNAFDPDFNGVVFKGTSCNYASVMSAITGTDKGEWK